MHESILLLPPSRLEDVVLDKQENASDTALREVLEVIESGDEIQELRENLGIQFDYNGSVLTRVQKQALSKICLAKLWLFLTAHSNTRSKRKSVGLDNYRLISTSGFLSVFKLPQHNMS